MDIDRARYLVSGAGRGALDALPAALTGLDPVRLATELRRSFPPFEASALAEQVTLRAKARERGIEGMLLSPHGLEMMTHPAVAAGRAARLAAAGLPVIDLTCGLGGDLSAVAAAGLPAAGLELDAPTALLARANVPAALIARGDAARPPFARAGSAVILDPSRREDGPRRFDPSAFSPPWDVALTLARDAALAVLKTAPGIEERHLPPDAEVEFVQFGRSMREAALWFGAGAAVGLRRAVLLPAGVELTSDGPECSPQPVPVSAFVFDPESCATRAGVVRQLAARLGARLLDPQVAYLTGDAASFDPMAATFEVLEVVPFGVARVRQLLRERRWRPVEIRRRAFPVEPDELRRLLGRVEGEPIALLCTTIAGTRTVVFARKVEDPSRAERAGEKTAQGCRQ